MLARTETVELVDPKAPAPPKLQHPNKVVRRRLVQAVTQAVPTLEADPHVATLAHVYVTEHRFRHQRRARRALQAYVAASVVSYCHKLQLSQDVRHVRVKVSCAVCMSDPTLVAVTATVRAKDSILDLWQAEIGIFFTLEPEEHHD